MISKTDKAKLGIFLAASLALALVVLGAFAGLRLWDRTDHYTIYSQESVSGLNVGSQVRLRGVQVGTVRKMRVDPKDVEQIEITVSLTPGTPVMSDTRAFVVMQGMTGLKFVDLQEGTKAGKRLAPGSTIPIGQGLISKLSSQAETLSTNADDVVKGVAQLMNEDNRKRIERVLERSEQLVGHADELVVELTKTLATTRQFLEKNDAALSTTLTNAASASSELQGLVRDARQTVRLGNAQLEQVNVGPLLRGLMETNAMVQTSLQALDMKALASTLQTVQLLLQQLAQTMSQNQEHLRAMLFNMRRTTDNLRDLSRDLRDKPSRLVFEDKPEPRKLP